MQRMVVCEHGHKHEIDEYGYLVNGVLVKIDLGDVIDLDLDGFLDQITEDAGFPLLMDIDYSVEGHEGNTLLIRVRGDASLYDESEDE